MSIDKIVNVSITRQTQTVSETGFGTLMVLGEHLNFSQRLKYYADTTELEGDGFTSSDDIHKAVTKAFLQSPAPERVAVGKKIELAGGQAIVGATNPVGDTVRLNITGHKLNVGVSITVSGFNEAEYNGTFTITNIVDVDNVEYEAASTPSATPATGTGTYSATETYTNALTKINEFENDWYGLVNTSRVQADVEETALWVEANKKLFVTASSNADILDSGITTDVASVLKALNYDRTVVIYTDDTDGFIDAGIMGLQLPTDPGSTTWKFKTIKGVTASNLTSNQETGAQGKNANIFTNIGGVDIFQEGVVIGGEFIDVIRGIDWLEARMEEKIFATLANLPKVPYTDGGVAIIESNINEIITLAIDNDVLAANPAPVITVPKVADVPSNDRGNRLLPSVTFTATLAGAIHKVTINGTVTI